MPASPHSCTRTLPYTHMLQRSSSFQRQRILSGALHETQSQTLLEAWPCSAPVRPAGSRAQRTSPVWTSGVRHCRLRGTGRIGLETSGDGGQRWIRCSFQLLWKSSPEPLQISPALKAKSQSFSWTGDKRRVQPGLGQGLRQSSAPQHDLDNPHVHVVCGRTRWASRTSSPVFYRSNTSPCSVKQS